MQGSFFKFRKTFIIFFGILVFVFALTGAVEYTSRSGFCVRCHEMGPAYYSWKTSQHRGVECIKCHSDSGPVALLQTKMKALNELYRHVTNSYSDPIALKSDTAQFSNRCLKCHSTIRGQSEPHNEMHFTSSISCTRCHDNLVHNPKMANQLPSRKVCEGCHGS